MLVAVEEQLARCFVDVPEPTADWSQSCGPAESLIGYKGAMLSGQTSSSQIMIHSQTEAFGKQTRMHNTHTHTGERKYIYPAASFQVPYPPGFSTLLHKCLFGSEVSAVSHWKILGQTVELPRRLTCITMCYFSPYRQIWAAGFSTLRRWDRHPGRCLPQSNASSLLPVWVKTQLHPLSLQVWS